MGQELERCQSAIRTAELIFNIKFSIVTTDWSKIDKQTSLYPLRLFDVVYTYINTL